MLFQKVIFGNMVNKAINGNIVNVMFKIIEHPIYNSTQTRVRISHGKRATGVRGIEVLPYIHGENELYDLNVRWRQIIVGIPCYFLRSFTVSKNLSAYTFAVWWRNWDSQWCKVSSCKQRGLWSDCIDTLANLSLSWAHILEGTYVCCDLYIETYLRDNFLSSLLYLGRAMRHVETCFQACANIEGPDQLAHLRSLIRIFTVR